MLQSDLKQFFGLGWWRDRLRQTGGLLLAAWLMHHGRPSHRGRFWLGTVMALIGGAIRLWAAGYIDKNQQLAQGGPYRYVRHPLYTGMIMLLLGVGMACGRRWALPLLIAFLLAFYPEVIRREDAWLQHRFGRQWEVWAATRSAILPNLKSNASTTISEGHWSLRQALLRNGEPLLALGLLLSLRGLHRRLKGRQS
jgi:uncharacterized membrane protein